MNRQVVALAAAVLGLALGVSACGSGGSANRGTDGRISVVASTDVYGDIATQVGGADVTVTSILTGPEQDPHSFEANPRTALAVKKADVLIENGGGYDDYMDVLRKAENASAPVLNAVKISGRTAPAGGELNEHVWYDLPSVQKVVTKLAATLASTDPDHAEGYRNRAKTFNQKVATLIGREAELKQVVAGKSIGITEPVPLYLTSALGLVNATPPAFSAAVEEGEDVAPRVLAQTLAQYSDQKVAALVYNEQTSGPVTERVEKAARDAGIPVVGMTETLPKGKDYLGWMDANLTAVGRALGAS